MAITVPRIGLKRMGLTLFLIIIYIFVGIKIIVACSAHKQATKFVQQRDLGTHVNIFHSKNTVPYVSMKKLQKGFPGGAVVENLPANAGDTGSSPGLGGSRVPWSGWDQIGRAHV